MYSKLFSLLVLLLMSSVATSKPSVKPAQQRQQTHKPVKAKKKTMPYLKWGVGLVAIGPVWYYRDKLSAIFTSITPQDTDDSLSDTSESEDKANLVIHNLLSDSSSDEKSEKDSIEHINDLGKKTRYHYEINKGFIDPPMIDWHMPEIIEHEPSIHCEISSIVNENYFNDSQIDIMAYQCDDAPLIPSQAVPLVKNVHSGLNSQPSRIISTRWSDDDELRTGHSLLVKQKNRKRNRSYSPNRNNSNSYTTPKNFEWTDTTTQQRDIDNSHDSEDQSDIS